MTDYSRLKSLLLDYDMADNQEHGWSADAVHVAAEALNAEMARLGITSRAEARRLASGQTAARKVEITGPAHVLNDGNEVRLFDSAEAARAANANGQCISCFIPEGKSQSFSVAA